MTEDEAKTKWCPQGSIELSLQMIHSAIITGDNIDAHKSVIEKLVKENRQKCIASDCMMWREVSEQQMDAKGKICAVEDGYCGLIK